MMTNMDKLYEAVEARALCAWAWTPISPTCPQIL